MFKVPRRSERGIALIITLILLAVTLVMALAFLAVSRRERSSVATNTDTTTARLAADSALAHAEAQVVANMLATSNAFNYGLLVSTNYINPAGYVSGSASPTNVNYSYFNGTPLNGPNDPLQNLANLQYSPRPPVFIITNQATGSNEFRFYLDLNRNGRFDDTLTNAPNVDRFGVTNGFIPVVGDPQWIGVLERPDAPHGPNNKFLARYAFIALPVGNTLDVNYIYNQAHQPGKSVMSPNGLDYMRNEGVGSWEINLAAFLADLNTNTYAWGSTYIYDPFGFGDTGNAFIDALALYRYRLNGPFTGFNDYAYNFNVLNSVNNLFGPIGNNAFSYDRIDGYSAGPLMTTTGLPADNDSLNVTYPWPGADNTNHFFTTQELFDPAKVSLGFTNRLLFAGNGVSTYDRYTFYRLLAQLGMDSAAEAGKINLNYDNLDRGSNGVLNINGTASATNFVPWTALNFFTNAADRMLKLYTSEWFETSPSNYLATYYGINYNYYHLDAYGNTVTNDPTGYGLTNVPYSGITNTIPAFGITNIPVLVNGSFVYSPAVQRVLQLAANIYDASTNKTAIWGKDYPSVFRPTFMRTNQNGYYNVYINGYQDISAYSETTTLNAGTAPLDPPVDVNLLPLGYTPSNPSLFGQPNGNVYGVPWIIGAKKGFPGFNKFTMQNIVQVERILLLTRQTLSDLPSTFKTNQMFIMSVSNSIAVEFWNSYNSNYVGSAIKVTALDRISMMITNNAGGGQPLVSFPIPYYVGGGTNLTVWWPGSAPWNADPLTGQPQPGSFIVPLNTTLVLLTNSIYNFASPGFTPTSPGFTNFPTTGIVPLPQFGLLTTNRLQAFVLDGNHVIDYVHFNGPNSSRNLNQEIGDFTANGTGLWHTNRGIYNQVIYSRNPLNNKPAAIGQANDDTNWKNPPNGNTVGFEIAYFDAFFHNGTHIGTGTDPNTLMTYTATNLELSAQVPFTPTRTSYEYTSWQANDPLVHYLASDLNFSAQDSTPPTGISQWNSSASPLPQPKFGVLNERYQPWGRNRAYPNSDANPYNLTYKDPLTWQSDNWDFPTNKYPTVGWLGRVHRGTPWQTVYLKAANVLGEFTVNGPNTNYIGTNTWAQWTGDTQLTYGQYYDAANSAPVQDRLLFDVFTTAFNDNATRGQLSVNVEANNSNPSAGLAAWSAVFSGVQVLTNTALTPSIGAAPAYTNRVVNPAGTYDAALPFTNLPPLVQIVQSINATRANTNLFPQRAFSHVGDILAVPALTQQSPFLNANLLQQQYGISDELYEWLPQQTLSLLRASGAPRYVIYCYGQTLTPAAGSIVTGATTLPSGQSVFGLCTNYSVVAETATRAVVRVDGVVDVNGLPINPPHPHIVIESFNVLPPD